MPDTPDDHDNLVALERFVAENDDLLALEAEIGRFNVFDALGVARRELQHSNFLAWLLDPAETHGQGDLFLQAVLIDLFKQTPAAKRPFTLVELDGADFRGVVVRREWRNVDILITCDEPRLVVAIENKVDSGEHSNQLQRYEDTVRAEWPDHPALFVFLTPSGDASSDGDWVEWSYGGLHRVITRAMQANTSAIGVDVAVLLSHYLKLLENRFMLNPKIDELCQRIYRNHRQAIDMIRDRAASIADPVIGTVVDCVKQRADQWELVNQTTREVQFIPRSWSDMLPAVSLRKSFDPRVWLVPCFNIYGPRISAQLAVWATSDQDLRRSVIDRLTQDGTPFGLRTRKRAEKSIGAMWNSLMSEEVYRWKEEDEPDLDEARSRTLSKLDELAARFSGIRGALQPIIEQWRTAKSRVDQ